MQPAHSVLGVAGSVLRLVARGRSLAAPSCAGVSSELGFGQPLRSSSGALCSVYHRWAEAAVPPAPPAGSLPAAPGHAPDGGHPHNTMRHSSTGASAAPPRDSQDAVPGCEPGAAPGPASLRQWQKGASVNVSRSSVPGEYRVGACAPVSGGLLSVAHTQSLWSEQSIHRTAQCGSSFFPDHSFRQPCCPLSTQGADGDGGATPRPGGSSAESEGGAAAASEGGGSEAAVSGAQLAAEGLVPAPGANGEGGVLEGEGIEGAASVEGAEGAVVAQMGTDGAEGPDGPEGAEGAEGAEDDVLDMGEGRPSMVPELAGAPRRVQRFMVQKLLKVKPSEAPSTAALRKKFQMRIVDVNRTAKVTKGGKVISFAALVVCGNGEGLVGFGRGKSAELGAAVDKAFARSLRNLHYFERYRGRTVAMEQMAKYGNTKVYLWPAARGSSMSAGTTVGGILRLAGFTEVKTKVIGSRNPINTVKATFKALGLIESAVERSSEQAASG